MKKCPKCNQQMLDSFVFCGNCGCAMNSDTKPTTAQGDDSKQEETDSDQPALEKPLAPFDSAAPSITSPIFVPAPVPTSSVSPTPEAPQTPPVPSSPTPVQSLNSQVPAQPFAPYPQPLPNPQPIQQPGYAQPVPLQPAPQQPSQPQGMSAYVNQGYGGKICPTCGTVANLPDAFCKRCGMQFVLGAAHAPKKKNLRLPNIGGIIASLSLIFASFLPYISVSLLGASASKSLMDGVDGYIFLGIGVITLILSIIGVNIPLIIIGALTTIFAIIENAYTGFQLRENDIEAICQKEIGYYLLIISPIVLFVVGIVGLELYYKRKRNY